MTKSNYAVNRSDKTLSKIFYSENCLIYKNRFSRGIIAKVNFLSAFPVRLRIFFCNDNFYSRVTKI